MHLANIFLLASSAAAVSLPNFLDITQLFARKDGSNCPAVWTSISKELTGKFLGGGECNPYARAAIRAVFHDCGGNSSFFSTSLHVLTLFSME